MNKNTRHFVWRGGVIKKESERKISIEGSSWTEEFFEESVEGRRRKRRRRRRR